MKSNQIISVTSYQLVVISYPKQLSRDMHTQRRKIDNKAIDFDDNLRKDSILSTTR